MAATQIDNWFAPGALIADHLKRQGWPDIRAFLIEEDLAGVQESAQPTPAFHVLYGGFEIPEQANRGGVLLVVAQFWDVVAAVRNVENTRELQARGGEMTMRAMVALAGYRPCEAYQALQPVPGLAPEFSETGEFGYYPMRYRTQFTARFGEANRLQSRYGI